MIDLVFKVSIFIILFSISAWFSGAFTSGVASGISIKIPYAADAVHTVVEISFQQ